MLSTAATSSQNHRYTGIAGRLKAGSIAVCRAGAEVALHLATTQGELVVVMREIDFVRGARGPKDHNGLPFRTVEQLDVEKRRAQEAAALIAPVPEVLKPDTGSTPRAEYGTSSLICAKVQQAKDEGSPLSFRNLCQINGVSQTTFTAWRKVHGHSKPRNFRKPVRL